MPPYSMCLRKCDRSTPSNYRPIALFSCLSEAFESILNRKIQKHVSTSDLLSELQNGFRKQRSSGYLLTLLTDSWLSSLGRFGETFSVALHISKALSVSVSVSVAICLSIAFCLSVALCLSVAVCLSLSLSVSLLLSVSVSLPTSVSIPVLCV